MSAEKRAKNEGRNCIRLARPPGIQAAATTPVAITRKELLECALWSHQYLHPRLSHPFGDVVHSYLARDLTKRLAESSYDNLDSNHTSMQNKARY